MIEQMPDAVMTQICRSALPLIGKDVTSRMAGRSCLVLAPHPDDEVLGCGVTIMRKTDAGSPVKVVFATSGDRSHASGRMGPGELVRNREAEAVNCCVGMGVRREDVVFLRFGEMSLDERISDLQDAIYDEISAFQPDEILAPSLLDSNRDHQSVSRAVRALLKQGRIACPVYEYPVWALYPRWWRSWLRDTLRQARILRRCPNPGSTTARPHLIRTSGYLPRKRDCLAAHVSQVSRMEDDPKWPILADVENGRFLARFFGRYEVFFPAGIR